MRRVGQALGPLLVLMLVSAAGYLLFHELHHFQWKQFRESIYELPKWRVASAIALTCLSYTILVGYDLLALEYAGRRLPLTQTALVSFISFTTSYNFGALLGGTSARFRLYTTSGLSALDVTKIAAAIGFTFWLGASALGSVLFLSIPLELPSQIKLPLVTTRPLGALLLIGLIGYLVLTIVWRKPIRFRAWQVTLPGIGLSLVQLVVAVADLVVAGAVPYMLLAPSISVGYPTFLAAWLLGIWLSLMTHVPGGIGVLELTLIWFLKPIHLDRALAALLVFRCIYYFAPLFIAATLMVGREYLAHRRQIERVRSMLSGVGVLVPNLVALLAFAGGVVLLVSGAIPPVASRMAGLREALPLPLVEASHFFGSLAGAALLILAWGLARRLDTAFWLTAVLLSLGMILSLLKGLDYEQALLLAIVLALLVAARAHFYRRGSLLNDPLSAGWMISIGVVLVGSFWLGMFAHRHVQYANELWWTFSFHGDAPRWLRAMVGATVLVLVFAAINLIGAARPRRAPATPRDESVVSEIVTRSPRASANLALLGDKHFLLNEAQTSFIMYGVQGNSWISLGDPIGPPADWSELVWRFREVCDCHMANSVFYQVATANLPVYIDLGLSLIKLGEEARVPLADFSLEGSERRSLRQSHHRLEREGCQCEIVPADGVPAIMAELRAVSDAWLESKHVREKGFSLGFFDEKYLSRFPIAVVRKEARVVAFSNLWTSAEHEELSADLIRYRPDAVSGVMEALLIEVMLWGKQQQYRWFNLGMAPLAGLETHPLAPLWNRLGDVLFEHGEHFYNFRGLRQYKEKFSPVWEPRYLAARGGLALPRILTDVAVLISGGLKGLLTK